MTKDNFDAQTDNPKTAFTELAANVDLYNALVALLFECAGLALGSASGLVNTAGNLTVNLSATGGLEIVTNEIKIKLPANSGLKRVAGGLSVDIGSLSVGAHDTAADYVAFLDATDGVLKKVLLEKIGSTTGIEVFDSSGTFTPRTGVTTVLVKAIGAGGGGSGAHTGANEQGGAGGGGEIMVAKVDITGAVAVTIGAGGTGSTGAAFGNGPPGNPGADSTFGSFLTVKPGLGGINGGAGGVGGAGGTGGTISGAGTKLLAQRDGIAGASQSGVGADAGYQDSLLSGPLGTTGNGASGVNPGDGGAGAGSGAFAVGGTGSSGYIIVSW